MVNIATDGTVVSTKDKMVENGLSWDLISKCQKYLSNDSKTSLELFYAKHGVKKHLLFER